VIGHTLAFVAGAIITRVAIWAYDHYRYRRSELYKCRRAWASHMEKVEARDVPSLIKQFKKRRLELNLSLREVERRTGISNSYLSQLESGKATNPSHKVIITLSNLYGLEQESSTVPPCETEKCDQHFKDIECGHPDDHYEFSCKDQISKAIS